MAVELCSDAKSGGMVRYATANAPYKLQIGMVRYAIANAPYK